MVHGMTPRGFLSDSSARDAGGRNDRRLFDVLLSTLTPSWGETVALHPPVELGPGSGTLGCAADVITSTGALEGAWGPWCLGPPRVHAPARVAGVGPAAAAAAARSAPGGGGGEVGTRPPPSSVPAAVTGARTRGRPKHQGPQSPPKTPVDVMTSAAQPERHPRVASASTTTRQQDDDHYVHLRLALTNR